MNAKIVAIIVTYHPEKCTLQEQLYALLPQVDAAVIVDNNSSVEHLLWLSELCLQHEKLVLISLEQNFGIAKAQNEGIAWAREQEASFLLFMDQDSLPSANMVVDLYNCYQRLFSATSKIAAIGPRLEDKVTGKIFKHVKLGFLSGIEARCTNKESVSVDILASSGSLVPIDAINNVGLMDEKLFIDYVDIEWGLRAKEKGWLLIGLCNSKMKHSFGEKTIKFWFFGFKYVPVHKPFRYYYIFRNSIILHKRDYMGWRWKWVDLIRLLQITAFMSIVANERRKKIKMIWKGIIAGIRGETGKMPH